MRLATLCIAAATLISSSSAGRAQDAGFGSATQPSPFLVGVLQLALESCLKSGDKPAELAALAKARSWKAATDIELAKHNNAFTRMIGGWIFSDAISSYAVLQSFSAGPPKVFVCSITTNLGDGDFEKFRALFENKLSFTADQVLETPTTSTHRYSVQRQDRTTVRTSLVSTPAQSMLTIRMIHGVALPPDS
jgi:hypothetical protein